MSTFKVYICQGPEKHVASVTGCAGRPEWHISRCLLCDSLVDEVEVVRVDEILSDENVAVATTIYRAILHQLMPYQAPEETVRLLLRAALGLGGENE